MKLSESDVQRLISDSSAETRVDTAAKVAGEFRDNTLSGEGRALALQIFAIMVEDAEVRVREALSQHLKECPDIPHDIALALAHDVDSVALPFIEVSQMLTDDDLIEIVAAADEARQCAVARRDPVSIRVTDALVELGAERAVATVIDNPGAEVSEAAFDCALERFPRSEAVRAALRRRPHLPIRISERLVSMTAERLQRRLDDNAPMAVDETAELIRHVRERATLSLADRDGGLGDAQELARVLDVNGKLCDTILLRALCTGDMAFFEAGLARLAKVQTSNARILIHDEGRKGLKAIWGKAGLPPDLLPAVIVALDVAEEVERDGEWHDRDGYRRRVMERVLSRYGKSLPHGSGLDDANLDHLLASLGGHGAEDAVRH